METKKMRNGGKKEEMEEGREDVGCEIEVGKE